MSKFRVGDRVTTIEGDEVQIVKIAKPKYRVVSFKTAGAYWIHPGHLRYRTHAPKKPVRMVATNVWLLQNSDGSWGVEFDKTLARDYAKRFGCTLRRAYAKKGK